MTYKEKMDKINKLHDICDINCIQIDKELKIKLDKINYMYDKNYIDLTEKYMLIQKEIIDAKQAVDAEYRYKFQLIDELAAEEVSND